MLTIELKLLLRHWSTWIVAGAMLLLVVLITLTNSGTVGYQYWPQQILRLVYNVLFFQFPLLAILSGSRLTQLIAPRSDWLWVRPIDARQVFAAQMGAVLLITLLSQLASLGLATGILLASAVLPLSALPGAIGTAMGLLIGPTLLQLGTIACLSVLLRRTIWIIAPVLAFTIAVWLGLVTPSVYLGSGLDYTWLSLNFQTVNGLGPDRPLAIFQTLLYGSLGVLLLALAVLVASRLDYRLQLRQRSRRLLHGAALLLLIVGILSTWQFRQLAQASVVPASADPQLWTVMQAAHVAQIDQDGLMVQAQLRLANPAAEARSTVILRLNPCLQVTQATQDGQSAPVTVMGETVQVALPTAVAAQQTVNLDLQYAGELCLLREDYAPLRMIRGEYPASYIREVGNIQDAHLLWLSRDGDWRIWPLQAGPATAPQQTIELNLDLAMPVVATTGVAIQQRYTWTDTIPEPLLVAGDLTGIATDTSVLWLPAQAAEYDRDYAQRLATLHAALHQELGSPEPDRPVQIVLLPWLNNIVVGPGIVVAPALDPAPVDERTAQAGAYWSLRTLANRLVYATLFDQVQPTSQLTTTGQLISKSITCGRPDASGKQHCTLAYDPDNPQVVGRRWVEQDASPALLQALSIMIGAQITLGITHDQAAFDGEMAYWRHESTSLDTPAARLNLLKVHRLDTDELNEYNNEAAVEALLERMAAHAGCIAPAALVAQMPPAQSDPAWSEIEAQIEDMYADCN